MATIESGDLVHNETTEKAYTDITLESGENIYIDCPIHGIPLPFKVFSGDSIILEPQQCPRCTGELLGGEIASDQNQEPEQKIIDQIQRVRSNNNHNWMDILRLAFKHAPRQAKFIMKDIAECDQKINTLTKELVT